MTKSSDTILESANLWIETHKKVALATVIETWGSSPCQIGSKMIVNEKGEFLGSVSGGCVEANVISECLELMKNNNPLIIPRNHKVEEALEAAEKNNLEPFNNLVEILKND